MPVPIRPHRIYGDKLPPETVRPQGPTPATAHNHAAVDRQIVGKRPRPWSFSTLSPIPMARVITLSRARCAYRAVVCICVCPRILPIIGGLALTV